MNRIPPDGNVHGYAFRLKPKDSLKDELTNMAQTIFTKHNCTSLFVMTAVGSLDNVTLRLANASKENKESRNEIKEWKNQRFEIVSLVGTFSRDKSCHLHLSISDKDGNTFGGHLISGRIFTTCEVVLGSLENVHFIRELDYETGFNELLPIQIKRNESGWYGVDEFFKATFFIFLGYSLHYVTTSRRR